MKNSTYEKYTIAASLIQDFYHLQISVFDQEDQIEKFIDKNRIHNVQAFFTSEILNLYTQQYVPDRIYYLTDAFMVHLVIFFIEENPVVIGPFCTLLMTPKDARTIFDQYKITNLSQTDFFSYLSSLPAIKESELFRMVSSLIHTVCPQSPEKQIQHINFFNHTALIPKEYETREHYTELLEKRYTYEQHFIQAIERGNSRSAIFNLHNMQMDVAYLKRIGTTLENERIGAAITRTTVRLAALRSGLPAIVVDRISSQNTAVTHSAKSVEEILTAKEKMIREFCNAIHHYKDQKYSFLVQSALYFFDHEYYKDIRIKELADELNVSLNYLISVFRKETGTTPNSYLQKSRMKQASILLSSTDMSMQEISSSVGISDANYFIKVFKKLYGETPTNYRRKYRS
ncbi:helix-turn-helix transcriptional regulator [Clostridium boliviensis]|uniref:Helix-turn-helix transcriptional regulator n=1 Tax=Clostridium boliviensis TaxID=318465 RepID=A0ABU4GF08_9CLOT|nr:helix-turn-helix transcriptional regulator [Clostridium boliviensis]MDW2796211.1 helix-turn-helix transcriptional regulator [Clostridium boliviensis]